MTYQHILYSLTGGIARITLNRPDKLNAFNVTMHGELRDALDRVRAGPARVLLLHGAGRCFCAGQDLDERDLSPGKPPPDLGLTLETLYRPLVLGLRTLPMPVICAVSGVAAGAGASVALACDIVLAARSASFVQSFCKLGLIPDAGASHTVPRLIGTARAMGLALLGDKLPAEQAEAWGLIWKCVADDQLMAEAERLSLHFSTAPTKGLALTKQAIYASAEHTLEQQLDLERDSQRDAGWSDDYREGVNAFKEKRLPHFSGK
ncbi:MAG: 2-(1,2-epoxy-1,2-dihydrophenyl)acetyl-CoA isomerase PaaG [Proteobacteria bacterium]|nr:2-(1,2-epoxy-1,2-dihydrophenyl)acetyl-CoA isomerase PaaG [Pseudomonadota bacterium]